MNKLNLKISKIASPVLMICGLLLGIPSARAQSPAAVCSNRSLQGMYGFLAQGVVIGLPGLPQEAQFRSVGMTQFDGKGNLTWLENTVINGVPLQATWVSASGTYAVNSNCTGTAVVTTPNSPVPLNLVFALVRQGKEVNSVQNANAIATIFTKVE